MIDVNQYESAHRARKVDALLAAIRRVTDLPNHDDLLRLDADVLAAVPAELRAEFADLEADITPPSDKTWNQLVATVRIQQRLIRDRLANPDRDPFAGL